MFNKALYVKQPPSYPLLYNIIMNCITLGHALKKLLINRNVYHIDGKHFVDSYMEGLQYSPKERYEQLLQGISQDKVGAFMKQFHLSQKQLAELLAVSDKKHCTHSEKKGSLNSLLATAFC